MEFPNRMLIFGARTKMVPTPSRSTKQGLAGNTKPRRATTYLHRFRPAPNEAAPPGRRLSSALSPPATVQVHDITLTGCTSGIGLGLNTDNRVTIMKLDGPAGISGLIAVGDRIVAVDGEPLRGRQLKQVLRPADRHVFAVEGSSSSPFGSAIATAVFAAAPGYPQDSPSMTNPVEPPEQPPEQPLPPLPPSRAALFASLIQKARPPCQSGVL